MRTMLQRGSRRIMAVVPAGADFEWQFDCGHVEIRTGKPGLGQGRAICKTCRRETPSRPEGPPNMTAIVEANKRLRAWRSSRGICLRCREPALEGKTLCRKHREQDAAAQRKNYLARKARASASLPSSNSTETK